MSQGLGPFHMWWKARYHACQVLTVAGPPSLLLEARFFLPMLISFIWLAVYSGLQYDRARDVQ